jgi:phage terminase large subunit-like protein
MSPRNHADCTDSFCDAVLSGEIIAGRYVQLSIERHLDDLEHAHQRGLHFEAGKSLRFVEAVCTHQKAEWVGQAFLLSPNQQFILWNLIGWRRADGCRRAYITEGWKWGKSLVASAIMKLLTRRMSPMLRFTRSRLQKIRPGSCMTHFCRWCVCHAE